MEAIPRARLDVIAAAVWAIPDDDLPPGHRRSRPDALRDGPGNTLAIGDEVIIFGGRANVIGHARGQAWILVAWLEDGNDSYGPFHRRDVGRV